MICTRCMSAWHDIGRCWDLWVWGGGWDQAVVQMDEGCQHGRFNRDGILPPVAAAAEKALQGVKRFYVGAYLVSRLFLFTGNLN